MAKIEFPNIDKYSKQLASLGAKAEGVCKYAIYPAASIVIDAIRQATPKDTGDLEDSLALTPMVNDEGYVYTKVVFSGYDRKGVPNALKANVIERGISDSERKKHPFVRPAVNRVKAAAQFTMEKALDEKLNEIMKG